jgi:hypothetical protein
MQGWKAACFQQQRMKTACFLLIRLLPVTGSAQLLTLGFLGGTPAQTPLTRATDQMPFAIGPTVDWRVASRFSIESGFLYYRLGNRNDNFAFAFPENALTLGLEQWHGKAIEIPFLLKYRFLSQRRGWQPFLSAGSAVRRTSLDFTRTSTILSGEALSSGSGQPVMNAKSVKWNLDPVVGAGISFRTGRFSFDPQVRYSYWGAGKNSVVLKNQVHFLVGFRF